MYLLGVFWLVVATAALPVLPDQPTLSNLKHANHHSKIRTHVNKKNPLTGSIKGLQESEECAQMCDPLEVEVPPNPSKLPCALTEPQDLEVPANIPCVETDIAQKSDPTDEEEVKPKLGKCATGVIPTPPELPPFDYSILRKQMADQKQKLKNCGKHNPLCLKKEKQPVILENPLEVEVPPDHSTLPCALTEPRDLDVPANIPCVQISDPTDEEEVKPNLGKYATGVVPAPPELPPFDYSILRKLVADRKQKFHEELRKPKLIEDCKHIKKPTPCGESNPLEEIKKEAVECSEDSPVMVQLKKPCGTYLNKLKANCSPSPCSG